MTTPPTALHGIVSESNVHISMDATSGHICGCHLRVLLRQTGRGTPLIEAIVHTGVGNAGQERAIRLKRRLTRGTHAAAYGHGVAIVHPINGGDAMLRVLHCQFIRSTEQAETTEVHA